MKIDALFSINHFNNIYSYEKSNCKRRSLRCIFRRVSRKNGREVKLANCRRLWYWDGAASISQLAVNGTTNPHECKFTVTVPEIEILDVIEIIPCSDEAVKSIESVPVWAR